jgi:hypothetical protein
VRYLLLAAWILLSAGAASADWDEVMAALERAGGPAYDIGADPSESEWVATRKARFERERASERGAKHGAEILRDRNSCQKSTLDGHILRCE